MEAQTEAFKYAEQKFDVGLINSVEYNEIKKELTLAQSELLQAKYDYIFKTTISEFLHGQSAFDRIRIRMYMINS